MVAFFFIVSYVNPPFGAHAPLSLGGGKYKKLLWLYSCPFGGRMSEGQEGGLFSLIADVKYLIAVVIIHFQEL